MAAVSGGYFGLAKAPLRQRQPEAALDALAQALERSHAAQDVREDLDDWIEIHAADPSLPGLDAALHRLRGWHAEREPALTRRPGLLRAGPHRPASTAGPN